MCVNWTWCEVNQSLPPSVEIKKRELREQNSIQTCDLVARKPATWLSYDSSVEDLITSLKGRKFNCITTFSSQNHQVTVVTALGYQVKNWTINHNCVFRQYTFSEISNKLSENTIIMECPFLYFDIHASERGVFVSDESFYSCRRNVCPYRSKVVNIHLIGRYPLY